MCYRSRLLINYFNARESGYVFKRKFTKFCEKNAKYGSLRRLRSFKVTEFGTNRKLIPVYDFLLVTYLLSCTVSEI